MKRVVVTGATSMIGVALIQECIKKNVEVLAVTRKASENISRLPESDLIKVLECDLDELKILGHNGEKYDVFYHMGWSHTTREGREHPSLQAENIQYTLEAVELAKRLGCRKFVGTGSQAEYGNIRERITSDTIEHPSSSYGIAKYAAGKLSRKLCDKYGIIHIWARIFSVYGKYDRKDTMLNYAINQSLNGEPAMFSSATQLWDYLYEEDAGKMLYLLGKRIEQSKLYCIASGKPRPLKEYILELKDVLDGKLLCEFAPAVDNEYMINLNVDTHELLQDIGYMPQVSFREGISNIVSYKKIMNEEARINF